MGEGVGHSVFLLPTQRILRPYDHSLCLCREVAVTLGRTGGVAGGLMALLFPDDSGVVNHMQNTAAVDSSHLAQAGNADA